MAVDNVESGDEPLAPFLIEGANRGPQAFDRLSQVVGLGDELVAGSQDLDQLVVGAQVDGAEPLALLAQVLEPALDLDAAGQRFVGLMFGKGGKACRLTIQFGRDGVLSSSSRARAPSRRSSEAARCSRAALMASSAARAARSASASAVSASASASAALFRAASASPCSSASARRVRAKSVGASAKLGPLPLRFRLPFRKLGDAALRMGEPLIPRRPLCQDRGAPRGARRGLAGDRLRRRARFGEGGALARRRFARLPRLCGDLVARPKLSQRGLRGALAFGGLVAGGAGA